MPGCPPHLMSAFANPVDAVSISQVVLDWYEYSRVLLNTLAESTSYTIVSRRPMKNRPPTIGMRVPTCFQL